jgi:DNA-binding transcriptional regulator YhcF (GntR family)
MNNLDNLSSVFRINEKIKESKSKQIVNSVINGIKSNLLKIGDRLPSLNEISFEYCLSKDTVQRAYIELRDRGIIESVPGKGFFIKGSYTEDPLRILLVFNKLSAYKKIIYNAFMYAMNTQAIIDLQVHNYDAQRFSHIIRDNLNDYDFYVIMPFFFEYNKQVIDVFKLIPRDKLILVNKDINFIDPPYPVIYEDFENDIQEALTDVLDEIINYSRVILIFPLAPMSNIEIITGFEKFCTKHQLHHDVVLGISHIEPEFKDLYIVIDDDDLADLIKICRDKKLKIGSKVGIISYNETVLKEVLAEGITVISTDFKYMGEKIAELILNKEKVKIKNPFRMIRRTSF